MPRRSWDPGLARCSKGRVGQHPLSGRDQSLIWQETFLPHDGVVSVEIGIRNFRQGERQIQLFAHIWELPTAMLEWDFHPTVCGDPSYGLLQLIADSLVSSPTSIELGEAVCD